MSYQDMTAAKRKGNQLPSRLQCSLCNNFKGHEHFSKKQLSDAKWKVGAGGRPSNLRCVICNGKGGRLELECVQCGDTKPHTDFSKTSRSAGGNQWCMSCTMFMDAALPDSEQNEITAQDRLGPMVGESHNNDWAPSSTAEGRTASNAVTPSFAKTTREDGSLTDMAATLRAMKLQGSQVSSAASSVALDGYIPPHSRRMGSQAGQADDSNSVSSASNIYEGARSSVTQSVLSEPEPQWQTILPKKRVYQAWGPTGQHQTREDSGPASATTPVSASHAPPVAAATRASGNNGQWAKRAPHRGNTATGLSAPEPAPELNNRYDSDSDDFDDP